jgi:hypothetical protein
MAFRLKISATTSMATSLPLLSWQDWHGWWKGFGCDRYWMQKVKCIFPENLTKVAGFRPMTESSCEQISGGASWR